jgi:hypothetical protein
MMTGCENPHFAVFFSLCSFSRACFFVRCETPTQTFFFFLSTYSYVSSLRLRRLTPVLREANNEKRSPSFVLHHSPSTHASPSGCSTA